MQRKDEEVSAFISGENICPESETYFQDISIVSEGAFCLIAKAKRYGRWWALKGLKAEFRHSSVHIALLRKEFEILISMQHPGIVVGVSWEQVADVGDCIVMEWIDGQTLREWLATKPNRPARYRIAAQMMDALEYVHDKQTAHRDLKPSNILITRNGTNVKLIDFGLSDTDTHAILKQPVGTAGYVAPEQRTSSVADVRNDIFSLGCIFTEMHLGGLYAPIVRRCKSPVAERRYRNIAALRRAMRRAQNWKRTGIAALLCGIFFGALTLAFQQIPKDAEIYAVADSLQKNVEQNQKTSDSLRTELEKLQPQLDFANEELKRKTEHDEHIKRIIADGKRRMNAIAAYNLDQLTTVEVGLKVYNETTNALLAFWEKYPTQFPDISETDAATIRTVLAEHYTLCIRPMKTKLKKLERESHHSL